MKINKRERTLLVVTVILIFLGVNYFLLLPLARNWGGLGLRLKNERRELAAMKETIQRKPGWQAEYDKLKEGLGQRSERFQQTSDVLKRIEEVGSSSGILITARRPMPVVEKDVYRELPVQCTFEATTESLTKFLFALQTGSGLMSVEQISVSPRPENPGILRCDIQVRALAGKSEAPAS